MITKIFSIACLLGLAASVTVSQTTERTVSYTPEWQSVEKVNPVPEWFKDAKFGIYFHWGVYSVPAFGNEWYPRTMYMKGTPENKHHTDAYGDLGQWPYSKFITGGNDKKGNFIQFAPKLRSQGGSFDPDEWARLFADAGAQFAGPVAEHHDGFSMYASTVNPWNAKDMGPKLDLVGLLTDAIRKQKMKVILSMHHAYNITGFYEAVPPQTDPKLQILYGQQGKEKNEELWLKKHQEIIDQYKPDVIWQDFNLHVISQSVLLKFLSYYYTKAAQWEKEVVATYKDGLNHNCGVLDYERGGPTDLTEYYWLSDDAISSSSWCYTEGIGYYSKKQILQGLIDRVSKNGNLLLNISPKADGTIPQEQKDVLLAMGAWLKKYGESVYATRAWEKYGEGPTKMGAAHGVFIAPAEGTSEDIRYTRSKDAKTLYAILLGWTPGQKQAVLRSLSSSRIDIRTLRSVSLLTGTPGRQTPLAYSQDTTGLVLQLPERHTDEMAYVVKLSFDGRIPPLNNYAEVDCAPMYYLMPGDRTVLSMNASGTLSAQRHTPDQRWKFESIGHGIYRISTDAQHYLTLSSVGSGPRIQFSAASGAGDQLWKIDESYNGLVTIANIQHPRALLGVAPDAKEGAEILVVSDERAVKTGWKLAEVCLQKQEAHAKLTIPGTIEAEDFDRGCAGEAYFDTDSRNEGGQYRTETGVDIEKCEAGGFNVGWTNSGEWLAYTVDVEKSGVYRADLSIAAAADGLTLHCEMDGVMVGDSLVAMNTGGYQQWKPLTTKVSLTAGRHIMKLVFDGTASRFNIDKVVFTIE